MFDRGSLKISDFLEIVLHELDVACILCRTAIAHLLSICHKLTHRPTGFRNNYRKWFRSYSWWWCIVCLRPSIARQKNNKPNTHHDNPVLWIESQTEFWLSVLKNLSAVSLKNVPRISSPSRNETSWSKTHNYWLQNLFNLPRPEGQCWTICLLL